MPRQRSTAPDPESSEAVLVGRIAKGDHAAFEVVMRRHNGGLFRVARAILKDDHEAEDALQDSYLDAYRHIGSFRGEARLATWLTRIVVNHALMRARKRDRPEVVVSFDRSDHDDQTARIVDRLADDNAESPDRTALRSELRRIMERRIDDLPATFRVAFVMRDVEDMPVDEIAHCLGIPAGTVRTRVFRARALLREALARDMDVAGADVFGFAGDRCDRIVRHVLAHVEKSED